MPMALTDAVCNRLSSLGLRQDHVHSILDDVNRWLAESGPEWTIERLKTLKLEAIHRLAGSDYRAPWVARSNDGLPSGVWRHLVQPGRKPKDIQRRLSALMVYSSLVRSGEPTKQQWEKFRSSVENPPPQVWDVKLRVPKVKISDRDLEHRIKDLIEDPLKYVPLSESRRVPVLGSLESGAVIPPSKPFSVPESDIESWFSVHSFGQSPMTSIRADCRLASDFVENLHRSAHGQPTQAFRRGEEVRGVLDVFSPSLVGRISFIQEPGYKLRAIANPDRLIQMWLTPFQRSLLSTLGKIEADCTMDQQKGVDVVQSWLRDGSRVHSVDLSDATNNFPLSTQIDTLSQMGEGLTDMYLRHFQYTAGLPWEVKDPNTGSWRHMQWTKGQPLGLAPSFMAFALAHHSVANEAAHGDYVLLGDDIVIRGDEPLSKYRRALSGLGVPVSEHKTLSSDRAAEFAGKVITADAVFAQGKYKTPGDNSFLDYVKNLGPKGIEHLPPRQRRVASFLACLPEEYGGLGMNPMGLPYSDRIQAGEAVRASSTPGDIRELASRRRVASAIGIRSATKRLRMADVVASSDQEEHATPLYTVKVRVNRMLRISTSRDPELAGLPDYVLGVPSDPRGLTRLLSEEQRIRALNSSAFAGDIPENVRLAAASLRSTSKWLPGVKPKGPRRPSQAPAAYRPPDTPGPRRGPSL